MLAKWRKLHQVTQRVQKRFASRALILMYHCVAEVDADPWGLYVTPDAFSEHLDVLRQLARPMSLSQLAQAHQSGKIPDRAVVITFDDGYANNLHYAKPLLQQYDIPATVFVSTGYIGQQHELWWDELAQALLQPGELPETLCLTINDQLHQWKLRSARQYTQADLQHDRQYQAWQASPGSRLDFYYILWKCLRHLSQDEQMRLVNEVMAWANVKTEFRSTHRMLSAQELHTLAEGNLVEIGAHTVTHPLLSAHSPLVQRNEIQRSKADLEQALARPVTSFAYPFGGFTPETVTLVQEAGFKCACTVLEDVTWQRSHSFQLPRIAVQSWSKEKLTQLLEKCFHI